MELGEQIIQQMQSNNIHTCMVMFNAEYFMNSGKQVWCELGRDKNDSMTLYFYIKRKTTDGESRVNLPKALHTLIDRVRSSEVYGMNLPLKSATDNFRIKMYAEYKIIMIESMAYYYARELAESQIKKQMEGQTLNLQTVAIPGAYDITPQYLATFLNNFWLHARVAYRDFVYRKYTTRDSRFIKTLYARNGIYKVMNVFVPVIINCNMIFNPLQDEAVLNSELYRLAIEKDRKATITTESSEITAYFLTQEEICKVFHLSKFMRFTPAFAYDIFMGLLYPGNSSEFPSLKSSVYQGSDLAIANGLPEFMSEMEYLQHRQNINSAQGLSAKPSFRYNNEQIPYDDFVSYIDSYIRIDSLRLECKMYAPIITHMGAHMLDPKRKSDEIVDAIYAIVADASL